MSSNITKRGKQFYFRVRIPKELVAAYGRTHVSLSLHTSDSHVAKRLARARMVELEQELQALRSTHAVPAAAAHQGTLLHLSDADIAVLCERYKSSMLAEDERQRLGGIGQIQLEVDLDLYEASMHTLRSAYAAGNVASVYPNLAHFLSSIDVRVPRQSPAYERLAVKFQLAELELHDALLQRRKGVAIPVPMVPPGQLSLQDVLGGWIASASRDPKTRRSFEQAFELLAKHCKVHTARLLRKQDASTFRNALLAGGDHSATTVSKFLGFLRAAFQVAVDDGSLGVRTVARKILPSP